ncbi:hypothetical protein NC653_037200 [Populus alba x Populus x berolinensis]|uniref:Uncharacterized protein n=1 Tax=Populus alba x Populus x berolinensis TaxID=444605 RepID=A0AAD6LEC4_9ROSI|nr:hypothetical protein NC653_037200 [Populus alba x Populus x berolinensis]
MDVIIIYQADQKVAALHLQNLTLVLDGSPSGYKEAHPLDQISNASSFHTLKLVGSTTVGWIISFAGKTPQVTAFTSVRATLEIQLPPLFTAIRERLALLHKSIQLVLGAEKL